jgi:hypothetical protein
LVNTTRYIVRHHHTRSGVPSLHLAGYGVELDVKKMDYVAKDDTKIQTSDEEGADQVVDEADDEWGV